MNYHSRLTQPAQSLRAETSNLAIDVTAGLSEPQKRISPKYFYDDEGSRLFEEITRLPEYYPTRTEFGILRRYAAEIAQLLPEDGALVEFGSGACTKVRILLDAAPQLATYVPVDISGDFLAREAAGLARAYPRLSIRPVHADFMHVMQLPDLPGSQPRAGFFPGSTIGNFDPHEATAFLRNARQTLGPGSVLIVGVDLVKDPKILHAAYNDSAGVTGRFNLNLLRRINRELSGNFRLQCFEHHAFYNREKSRIEMHLASIRRQKVRLAGLSFDFRPGETIHTENSYKYTPESFRCLARGAGWSPVRMWTDEAALFSVHALQA